MARSIRRIAGLAFHAQCLTNFGQGQAVDDVFAGQPAFSGGLDAEPEVLEPASRMGVRVN
jgi:hypothetical protein